MGKKTLLLVDDDAVLYRSGTERVVTPFERHPGNPLIESLGLPWEVAIGWTSVYRNPDSGRYQLWYQCFTGDQMPVRTNDCVVCYAESEDGVVFRKPELDFFPFKECARTNIVLIGNGGYSYRYGNFVVVDPEASEPDRRYKMAYFDFAGVGDDEEPGLCVAFSPDGIRWTKYPEAPLSLMAHGRGRLDHEVPYRDGESHRWIRPMTMSDAVDVMYDPVRQCYAIYGKMWINGPDGLMYWKHAMGRIESPDFINWSRPELILTPDDHDAPTVEFHTTPVFHHAGCYFSLFQIMNRSERGGTIDIELAISRDGMKWQRPFRDAFVLKRGAAGAFDSGSIFTNATPVILPDEIRIYFGGYSGGATSPDDRGALSGVGMARIPLDRFAGIRPQVVAAKSLAGDSFEGIGQVTLKPIEVCEESEIHLNADASSGGVIRVELLDETGRRLRGFSREEAVPVEGDSLRHPLRWRNSRLSELKGSRVMVRIHLERATVFAVSLTG